MSLSKRENELNVLVDSGLTFLEKGEYASLIQVCNDLLSNYQDIIDLEKELGLKKYRSRAYCEVGRYVEAKKELKYLLNHNMKCGLPIATSKQMYWWLVAHYEGDRDRAVNDHMKLTDETAISLLNAIEPDEGEFEGKELL